jgi:Flp pilus assembly protein TadD
VTLAETLLAGDKTDPARARLLLRRAVKRLKRTGDHASLASARFLLGEIARRRGELSAARREYRACLDLDPGNERARAALAGLDPEAATDP